MANGVSYTKLFQLRQENDEPFHAFAARVYGKAETCAFTTKCECTKIVNYTDHMIRDVRLHGISDMDIRRKMLGVSDILETAVNEVISIVEGKEMARNALLSANMSRISSFKQQQSQQPDPRALTSSPEQATCPDCKNLYKIFTQGPRGWNKKTHKVCLNCYRARRCRDRKQQHTSTLTPAVQSLASDPVLQVGTIEVNEPQLQSKCNSTPCSINTIVKQSPIILGHQVFTKGEWKRARQQEHPRVAITISIDSNEQAKYNEPTHALHIHVEVSAIPDTGAQSDVWSLSDFLAYRFSHDDLLPVNMGLSAANRSPISIEGAFFAKLTTKSHHGKEPLHNICQQLCPVNVSII